VHIFSADPQGILADLLHAGADMTARTGASGQTALHLTASARCARFLVVVARIPVDLRSTREGRTPLHVAVMRGRGSVARVLMGLGADPLAQDRRGESAASYARSRTTRLSRDTIEALLAVAEALEARENGASEDAASDHW
jgi:ankyrin repeat protein